jgi:hypothetical protein
MNKSILTIAAIAALAMPESGMASALPRTGPEPTEAEMRAAVEGKTDAMKEHFQHLERHCRNMQGGSSIAGLRCLFGTFGTQAASNLSRLAHSRKYSAAACLRAGRASISFTWIWAIWTFSK